MPTLAEETEELISAARQVQGTFALREDFIAGSVGAAIRSASGRIYTGVCLDLACGIGFCAEHSAVAEMLKHRESHIIMVATVGSSGILSPCGRCRELMIQINERNRQSLIILDKGGAVVLETLLPEHWLK